MNAMEFYLRSVDAQTWQDCEAEGVDPDAALAELPSPVPEPPATIVEVAPPAILPPQPPAPPPPPPQSPRGASAACPSHLANRRPPGATPACPSHPPKRLPPRKDLCTRPSPSNPSTGGRPSNQ